MPNKKALLPLKSAVRDFTALILSLPDDQFLTPMDKDKWAPRDVVAHLVGWNSLMIEASKSILAGKIPAYYADSPNDYSNINAVFTKKYASRSKHELLAELKSSLAGFEAFVLALPSEELSENHGVRHYSGSPATVTKIIASLAGDYRYHIRQVTDWQKLKGSRG